MMMKLKFSVITYGMGLTFFTLLFVFSYTNCTLIGYGIGTSIDTQQPREEKNIQAWEATTLKRHAHITVYFKDGETLQGTYQGVKKMDPVADSTATSLLLVKHRDNYSWHKIPFDKIDHVFVPSRKKQGRIIGATIGAVLDISALTLITIWVSNPLFTNSPSSLCPHIYSSDGTIYHLDAEMCSGAFYQTAQYTDRATLNHLRPTTDGLYKIKLANEMQETDFIDQLSLRIFDHPAGSRIFFTLGGQYLAVDQPLAPKNAYTSRGADVTALFNDNDEGSYWLSSPFGRNTENEADLRESVDLTFDKPAGASSVALLLTLRNTNWAALQHTKFLKLQGRNLNEWFAQINADCDARSDLKDNLQRENALLISVWDGTQWRPANPVDLVGPAVDRTIAQEIDLNGTPGETLKIRLNCPPGYWLINSAQVDFSYSKNIVAREILPHIALTQSGEDVTGLINRADGVYYSMPDSGYYAEVRFDCPPQPPGTERTTLIQCTGYYRPHIEPEGQPQVELANRLLLEPGFYNKWRLQTLNEAVKTNN